MILSPAFSSRNLRSRKAAAAQLYFGDPLLQEGGTIPKLNTFVLARRKESYNVPINEHYLHKIEDGTAALCPDQLLDRTHVFDLNSPRQSQYNFAIAASEPFDPTGH
jgi:hypothetical protein